MDEVGEQYIINPLANKFFGAEANATKEIVKYTANTLVTGTIFVQAF